MQKQFQGFLTTLHITHKRYFKNDSKETASCLGQCFYMRTWAEQFQNTKWTHSIAYANLDKYLCSDKRNNRRRKSRFLVYSLKLMGFFLRNFFFHYLSVWYKLLSMTSHTYNRDAKAFVWWINKKVKISNMFMWILH